MMPSSKKSFPHIHYHSTCTWDCYQRVVWSRLVYAAAKSAGCSPKQLEKELRISRRRILTALAALGPLVVKQGPRYSAVEPTDNSIFILRKNQALRWYKRFATYRYY